MESIYKQFRNDLFLSLKINQPQWCSGAVWIAAAESSRSEIKNSYIAWITFPSTVPSCLFLRHVSHLLQPSEDKTERKSCPLTPPSPVSALPIFKLVCFQLWPKPAAVLCCCSSAFQGLELPPSFPCSFKYLDATLLTMFAWSRKPRLCFD